MQNLMQNLMDIQCWNCKIIMVGEILLLYFSLKSE
jgi:hypothetical protein